VAGKKQKVDEWVSIAITCRYMGWTYEQYRNQPLAFIQTVTMLRQSESEEAERKVT
jgi:hypothetical protein